jgi:hypothetical protein
MPSVAIKLIMLSAVMLSVTMLSVVAPKMAWVHHNYHHTIDTHFKAYYDQHFQRKFIQKKKKKSARLTNIFGYFFGKNGWAKI